nr:hypothetical protein [Tanacetum cinerariifolium]
MLVDALPQPEVERQMNKMVKKVRGQEIRQEVVGMPRDQGSSRDNEANGGSDGVLDFATIIAHQLQNLLPTIIAQVGNHVNNQGTNKNQDDNVTNENSQGNVRTINNGRGGCSYKEFMACNPKDYDENVMDDNKRSRTGRAFATTTNPVRKEYTNNAPKCTNYNYHHQPEVPCRLCTNYNRFENLAMDCRLRPSLVNPPNARNVTVACGAYFKCSGMDHYKAACLRLNRAPRSGGNRLNQARVVDGGQGRGNNGVQARGKDFMMGE